MRAVLALTFAIMSHSFITQLLLAVSYFAAGFTASEVYRTFPLQWRIVRVVRCLERRGAHSALTATTLERAAGRPVHDAIGYLLAHGAIDEPQPNQYYLTRSRAAMMRSRVKIGSTLLIGSVVTIAAVCWMFWTI